MATSLVPVPLSATPFSKKFLIIGDGAEGVFPIDDGNNNPATSFAAALVDGPLRDTLVRADPTALHQLNCPGTRGNEIRIYICGDSVADAVVSVPSAHTVYWKAGATKAAAGLACTLPAPGENSMQRVIEIRLLHSTQG